MSFPIVPLAELCEMDRRGIRSDDSLASQLPFIGVENVGSGTGILDLDTDSRIGEQRSTAYRFDERHVLYAKLRPYLNKVATPGFAGRCSTELVPLLPRHGLDRDFLAHLLRRKETVDFATASVIGTRMPRTDMNILLSMRVPLLPIDKQRRTVDILNRLVRIQHLRAQAAKHVSEFSSTLFIEMFGDPIENPSGWARCHLGNVSEVQGGLQVTRKRASHPLERPYLRVANVLRGQLVLDTVKRIRLTERELARTRLKRSDLLIVEGHGNAAEIGRVAIWDDSVKDCVHQNHLIRVRPDHSFITSEFMCGYLNSSSGREHLLRSGKTTSGLNTITTSDVKACAIFVPPLTLQRRFSDIVGKVREVAATAEFGAGTASALSASLMSDLLGGSA